MEQIYPGIWKIRFGEPEEITPMAFKQKEPLEQELKKLPKASVPIKKSDICFKQTKRGIIIEYPLIEDESIYGFGLQLKSHNQIGKKRDLRVNADPVADTGDSHAPVPFYVSTQGYGLFVDTARNAKFYCGTHSKLGSEIHNFSSSRNEVGGNTDELYAKSLAIEGRNMVIEVPVVRGADIYIFGGPSMMNAVQRYNLFSGGGCIPPIWGLGMWYRTYGKFNADEVFKLAESFRKSSIPCDVLGLEPGWQSHSYSCSYSWDKERFPKPHELIDQLDKLDFKTNLWEHAFIHPTSPIYNSMKKYAGDYQVWDGLVPDFSIKEARETFAEYHRKEFIEKKISGFKLDECDSSDYIASPWSFPELAEFPSGIDGEQMHNLFGILYQSTILSAFQQNNSRTYSEVRSSGAFAAPLPFVVYSDLYNHKDFIRGIVNAGFSGLLWSPEVRQCDSVEELVRRLQTVVLSPQALINAWMIPTPPWLQYDIEKNLIGEIHKDAIKIESVCREIFELRMRLIPYLYSCFAKYKFEGFPPFRALVLDYTEDKRVHFIDDQYMMGDSIMVAPVEAGFKSRQVYLPKGDWYCFMTRKKYEGGKVYDIDSELEFIPMFIKAGTLLPIAKPVQYITETTCFEMEIYSFGNCNLPFYLFEDDGFSLDIENGDYNTIKLEWSEGLEPKMDRSGNYKGERYKIGSWIRID